MPITSPARTWIAASVALMVGTATHAATPQADQRVIVDSVRTMFAALSHDDAAQFHRVVCPGFYAFDVGKRFSGDELIALVKKFQGAGYVFEWNVTQPDVHTGKDMAWIAYVNRGSVTNASGKKDMTWLESATFARSGNGWCMAFLHSTPVPEK